MFNFPYLTSVVKPVKNLSDMLVLWQEIISLQLLYVILKKAARDCGPFDTCLVKILKTNKHAKENIKTESVIRGGIMNQFKLKKKKHQKTTVVTV